MKTTVRYLGTGCTNILHSSKFFLRMCPSFTRNWLSRDWQITTYETVCVQSAWTCVNFASVPRSLIASGFSGKSNFCAICFACVRLRSWRWVGVNQEIRQFHLSQVTHLSTSEGCGGGCCSWNEIEQCAAALLDRATRFTSPIIFARQARRGPPTTSPFYGCNGREVRAWNRGRARARISQLAPNGGQ